MSFAASSSQQVILTSRPHGIPGPEHFSLRTAPAPEPSAGQIVVRNRYLSVDPAMRGWVSSVANYSEPVPVGAVMRSFAVGEVLESRHEQFQPGQWVMGMFGWQEVALVDAESIWRTVTETDLSPSLALGVLGLNGLTAWAGVHKVLRPRPGSTVVVSTAAGAVGSIVGQLVTQMGCRAVGIAGGPEKAARCVDEFGYAVGLDYRADDFVEQLTHATPDGVDHYFDNTAGAISDAVLQRLAPHSSVLVCGTAALSSWDPWPHGPRVERVLLTQRARMEGFLAFDHLEGLPLAVSALADLVRQGTLSTREHILEGLESAPGAIQMLYSGQNEGKLVIRLP